MCVFPWKPISDIVFYVRMLCVLWLWLHTLQTQNWKHPYTKHSLHKFQTQNSKHRYTKHSLHVPNTELKTSLHKTQSSRSKHRTENILTQNTVFTSSKHRTQNIVTQNAVSHRLLCKVVLSSAFVTCDCRLFDFSVLCFEFSLLYSVLCHLACVFCLLNCTIKDIKESEVKQEDFFFQI